MHWWKRNDRYYARLAVSDRETGRTQGRRVPLKGVTAAQAQAEFRRLQTQREDGELPVLRQASSPSNTRLGLPQRFGRVQAALR